jgi:RimJ/RimL family protein N-acetyltransferase
VTLRPYSEGFAEHELRDLYAWGTDTELIRLAGGSPLDMPFARFRDLFLRQLPARNGDRQQLYAVLNESAQMIGRIGLFGFDSGGSMAELGVVIGNRDSWGRGYGREAVSALVADAFERVGLQRILLYTFEGNLRAQRAFASCGFKSLGSVRKFSFDRGTHLEVEMELCRDSWRMLSGSARAPGPHLSPDDSSTSAESGA